MTAAESVFEAVEAIKFGPAQVFRNLTLVPLVANEPFTADYAILDEALALGTVRIGETSETGRVPELKVLNHGDKAVFLLDGEELIGAKQARAFAKVVRGEPEAWPSAEDGVANMAVIDAVYRAAGLSPRR